MPKGEDPVNLHALIRHARPRHCEGGQAENRLDCLLEGHNRSREVSIAEEAAGSAPLSPLDRIRRTFEVDLIPTFEELRAKYETNGLKLSLDIENFRGGGRDITIVVEFDGAGMRFDGTVMSNAIAFQQTRYNDNDRSGLTASGPTLRTRDLDGTAFRAFVCDRIATLVQTVVQRKP